MERKLIVTVDVFNVEQRKRIRETAARCGLEALFFQDGEIAREAAGKGEILFGSSPELIPIMPNLKWICAPSAGLNQYLDPPELLPEGVLLSNSSGAYGVTIAEHVILVTLDILRRAEEYREIIRKRSWQRDLAIRSIRDSRVTLMGTGDIGREVASRMRAFIPERIAGMNLRGGNPEGLFDFCVQEEGLDALLQETDILVISLPATETTRHMLDGRRLALLPDGALVVNVGRGSVIEQKALEKELRAGRLWAALDVMEQEPVPAEDSLWDCPHLLMTPHSAGNMTLPWTVKRIMELFLEDLENYAGGRPLKRQVTRQKGY